MEGRGGDRCCRIEKDTIEYASRPLADELAMLIHQSAVGIKSEITLTNRTPQNRSTHRSTCDVRVLASSPASPLLLDAKC